MGATKYDIKLGGPKEDLAEYSTTENLAEIKY
jgi:hypothetical protein